MNKNKTRFYAMKVIYSVRFKQGYLNKELQKIQDLADGDQRLLTTITYGVIKKYDYLKAILLQNTERLKVKKQTEVLMLIALYQFIFLDRIPEYAIVDTTVELVKHVENDHVAKFVNAVLHKLVKTENLNSLNTDSLDRYEILALQYSMPLWIIKLLIAQYNYEQTVSFLEAVEQAPKQFIRFNKLKQQDFMAFAPEIVQTDLPYSAEYILGNAAQSDAFKQGDFTIQNISSQRLGYFVNPQKYDNILDMCAAPGGKSTHLAELTNDTAKILAVDLYEHRVKQIEENALRLGIKGITTMVADARSLDFPETFDKVILDAPCSGFGVLAQKPEIRYNITPEDLDALIVLQRELLEKAWESLKSGGTLIYSTCTINRKENEKQISWFLTKYPKAKLIEDVLIFDEMIKGYSGFYMAKIEK